jgi:hypothetical protein
MTTKTNRTQINDLPEQAVELSDLDMRIVSGGLASAAGCYSAQKKTNTSKDGDHDTDWTDPLTDTDFSVVTFLARLA